MRASWLDLDGQPLHGGASSQEGRVYFSSLPVSENAQVNNRAEMHTSEEEFGPYATPKPSLYVCSCLSTRPRLLLVTH